MKKEWNHYEPFEFIDLPYMKLLLNIWFVEGGRSVPQPVIFDIWCKVETWTSEKT